MIPRFCSQRRSGRRGTRKVPKVLLQKFLGKRGNDAASGSCVHRFLHPEKPGNDPCHISIDHGPGFAKTNGSYGRGGIGPYPFQFQKSLAGAGKTSPQFPGNCPGGLVQVARPGIIAQSLPEQQDFPFAGIRQGVHIREGCYETLEIRKALIHTGLLKDYLREPHAVRIGPGKDRYSGARAGPFYFFRTTPGEFSSWRDRFRQISLSSPPAFYKTLIFSALK
jgi:hypothetical protein